MFDFAVTGVHLSNKQLFAGSANGQIALVSVSNRMQGMLSYRSMAVLLAIIVFLLSWWWYNNFLLQ